MQKKPVIAIMYDFDKTLCPGEMQRFTFMPAIGVENPAEFWKASDDLALKNGMDPNLAYMLLMIQSAKEKGYSPTREWFKELGKGVQLYPGLTKWFERINAYGEELGATIEHYILSSGLVEMIEGTSIYSYFKRVYACEFLYDEKTKEAFWPKSIVNYTTKTQFLFRISKGTFELTDNEVINKHISDTERHCFYRNMIYIGDGSTDIPCMQLVKSRGGESIAVYPDAKNKLAAQSLLKEDRVSYMEKADYSQNSPLDKTMKRIINKMVINDSLARKRYDQINSLPEEDD